MRIYSREEKSGDKFYSGQVIIEWLWNLDFSFPTQHNFSGMSDNKSQITNIPYNKTNQKQVGTDKDKIWNCETGFKLIKKI